MTKLAKKIILVDDNSDDVFLSRLVISKSKYPFETIEFLEPLVALEYFANEAADGERILFLDINMPRINGFEFIDRYRKLFPQGNSRDKIVLLTTSLHNADKMRAESNDLIYRFLRKPLTIESYSQVIESLEAVD